MRKLNPTMAYISDFGWLVSKLLNLTPEIYTNSFLIFDAVNWAEIYLFAHYKTLWGYTQDMFPCVVNSLFYFQTVEYYDLYSFIL